LSTSTSLLTETDYATVATTTSATAQLVPHSLLEAHDYQILTLVASAFPFSRWVTTYVMPGQAPAAPLPDRIGETTFTMAEHGVSAAWSSLPAYDFAMVQTVSYDESQSIEMEASPAWIAATHATSLAFPDDVPGYQ